MVRLEVNLVIIAERLLHAEVALGGAQEAVVRVNLLDHLGFTQVDLGHIRPIPERTDQLRGGHLVHRREPALIVEGVLQLLYQFLLRLVTAQLDVGEDVFDYLVAFGSG